MSPAVGVDIGGTNCKLAWLDADGSLLRSDGFPTEGVSCPGAFLDRLVDRLESDPVQAVGLAMAGLVDAAGVVREAPNLPEYVGLDLAGELSSRLGGPAVVVENDVNAAAYAEVCLGAAKGARNAVMLALGTGVGGAIIVDGRLYRGTHGVAGELGHVTIQVDGPECTCGEPGHVEAYLGTAGIVIHAGGRLDGVSDDEKEPLLARCREEGGLSPRAVAAAADDGDPLSISILEDVGRLLGLACANCVNIFNPEVIVIGGGVAGAGDHLLRPARKSMKERAMPPSQQGVRLVAAQLGAEAAAIGAGLLALDVMGEDGETGS